MKKTLMLAFLLLGCVTVNYLPTDESASYPPTPEVEVLWASPVRPHRVIGRISASSEDYGETEIFKRLKQKAMEVGAHAIVVQKTGQIQQTYGYSSGYTFSLPLTRMEAYAIRYTD